MWVLTAATAIGLIVLFAPPMAGFDLSAVRSSKWVAFATLACGVLLVCRAADKAVHAVRQALPERPKPTLTLTVNSEVHRTYWGAVRQADGSVVTQISAKIHAYNPSLTPVRVVKARLIQPSVGAKDHLPSLVTVVVQGRGGVAERRYIPPRSNVDLGVTLMVRSEVRSARDGFLNAVIGVTDQHGYEHRVKVRLWPMGGQAAA